MKIRKAILPVAGMGTRTLPASKSVPKEMFPIVDKPVIQYLVEEAISAGIEEIIFVISKGKELIKDYFTRNEEFEKAITAKGRDQLLEPLNNIIDSVTFRFCYQDEPLGDGHAILCAEEFIDNEPCAVLFGDDLVQNETSALKQLSNDFEKCQCSILAVTKIEPEESNKYGVIDPEKQIGKCYQVKGMVEKPEKEDAPSDLGIIGKYIITPTVLSNLRNAQSGHGGEIRLIDGFIETLNKGEENIFACEVEGTRYDTGNIPGLISATIGYSKKDQN